MFKKDATLTTVVNNEEVYFIDFGPAGEWQILHSFSLDLFLNGDPVYGAIPEDLKSKDNVLLIVSDYWFGDASYNFQSKKKPLAEAFLKRKLLADHPDISGITNFFDYTFDKTETGDQRLYVYFLQESKSFQLYNQLTEANLTPREITTPAFLWEQKLKKIVPGFHEGGKGLVHLLPSECFLYFFSNGRYLFSRSIAVPDYENQASEIFNVLTYEINQSIYLFSQKTKAEVGQFYLISADKENARDLSEILGREVKDLRDLDRWQQPSAEVVRPIGPAGFFNAEDLSPSKEFLRLSHRDLKAELEWRPVQILGITIGLILLFLLGTESLFLWKWNKQGPAPTNETAIITETEPRQIIYQYNDALDLLLADTEHPPANEVIMEIARSLPDNVLIKELIIDVETNPGVDLQGVIKASGPNSFKNSLSLFIDNLNKHIRGPRPINIQDIDFMIDERNMERESQDYQISLRFALP
jgi:hypothetical protein